MLDARDLFWREEGEVGVYGVVLNRSTVVWEFPIVRVVLRAMRFRMIEPVQYFLDVPWYGYIDKSFGVVPC